MREREVTGVTDRAVSVGCVVACGLWAAAVALLVVSWLTTDDIGLSLGIGRTLMVVVSAAATATVRVYFVAHNRVMRSVLAVRDSVDEPIRAVR